MKYFAQLLQMIIVKFTNSGLSFSPFYSTFLFLFCFIFLSSIFRTTRVRVGSQDAENEEGESKTNDVTQHGHHILASWTTHGCLG